MQIVSFSDHLYYEMISYYLRLLPKDVRIWVNEDNRLRVAVEGLVHGLVSYETI